MCEKAVGKDLRVLELVPDQYKKEEICKKADFMTEKFKKSINKGNGFKAF